MNLFELALCTIGITYLTVQFFRVIDRIERRA